MSAEVVIAVYRPHPGKAAELEAILRRHVSTLRSLGLVTARPVTLLKSFKDGSYLEIFEWASNEAAQAAHRAPAVAALWEEMGAIADFPPLADLAETKKRFAHFAPVNGIVE
jgi:quinol monooxygenase YgiN